MLGYFNFFNAFLLHGGVCIYVVTHAHFIERAGFPI